MNDEYKTLGQIVNEPATQFGSRELDSGNPHAWSAEKERQFEQDISDVQRNYTVTTEDLKNYIDANPVSTGEKIALGLEQAGTQIMDAYRGLDQLIAKSPAMFPALTEQEKNDMVALTMHNYEAFTKARQDLINRKGVADSAWFNGANVLGQVALTTVAGVLTGGSTVPIVMGGVQEFGRKSGDYALKYAQATGDYSLKDQSIKDDIVALAYAGISAAIERGIGAERVLDGVIAQGAIKQLGKAAIGEAAEEFTQEMAEYLSDMTLDFMTNKAIYNDRTPMEAFKDALTGAVYGALGGGTMGFGMYYANRNALQQQFERAGYAPADAKQMAINAVDTAKDVVLREIITRDQLEKKYGPAYQDLVTKTYNSLKETNTVFGVRPEKENIGTLNLTEEQRKAYDAGQAVILNESQLHQYADTVASMLARQVMVVAAMQGTSTDMVLQLSDIEQLGNVVALNTPDMHNDVVVRRMQQQNKALQEKLKHERDLKKARNEGFQDEDDRIAILQSQQAALQRRLDELERQDQLDIELIKKNNGGVDISARAYADAAALKNATTADEFYKNLTTGQRAITTTPEQIQARYEEAILADIAGSPKEYRRLFMKGKISPQVRTNLLTNIAALRSTGLTGIQGDIKRALNRIASGCTLDNFAITFGNIRDENDINPFATAFVTYVLLSDPAGATQTVDLLAEKVNTIKQNIASGITTTQYQNRADIMSEALKESPLTADKWDGETTTDPNLLMLYDQKNVVNYAVQRAIKRAEKAQARIKETKDQYKIRYATDESLRKALLAGPNPVLTDPKIAQKYSHAALVKLFKDAGLSADLLEQKSAAELEEDARKAQTRKAARQYKTVKSLFWSTKTLKYNINRQFAEDWGIDKAFGVDLKYFQKDGGIQDWAQIQMTLSDNGLAQDDPHTDAALSESLEAEAKRMIEQNVPLNAEAAAQLDIAAEEERQRSYMESELLATGNYTQDQLNKMDLNDLDAELQNIRDIQAAAETDIENLPDIPFQELGEPYTAATINIDGKERPTTNSNGDPIATTEQGLRNFYKWFGDSKVVDEQGRPLVVYHGTEQKNLKELIPGRQSGTIYLTSDYKYAEFYAAGKNSIIKPTGDIMPLYVRINKPIDLGTIDVDDMLVNFDIQAFMKRNNIPDYAEQGLRTMVKIFLESETYRLEAEDDEIPSYEFFESAQFAQFMSLLGFDGFTSTEQMDNKQHQTFGVFDSKQIKSTANPGLFGTDTDKLLFQGKKKGGAFDPITKQVILGRNSNTGTLPHEIAHFWLNELFNRMQNNPNLPAQGKAMWDGLKRMLNITDDQTELTRDQHEQFATSAEAYIFNKTPLPKGTEPAYKDFLAYVPESYYTFMNMGWTGSDGQFHNPMLTEDDMRWFDSFFTGTGIIESAPVQTKAVSSNEPVKVSIMDGRKVMLDDAQKAIDNAGEKLETAVHESIPAASKVQIASTQNTIVKTADETLQIPAINNDDKPDSKPAFSFLHRGRGTDTRAEQLELTRKWAQEHWDEALAFALTDPAYSTNPSPADPATLIRVVAELNTDMTIKDQLNTNFALMMSQQGKSGGLNNDTHNSFFLKGLGQIQQNLANKYALSRYGTTKDAVERFDIEVKQFVDQRIADLQAGRMTVQDVMKQAAEIFGRDENADISDEMNTLFQELAGQGTPKSSFVKEIQKVIKKKDEARQERITLADQLAKNGKLGEYIGHLIKVQAGAELDTKTKAEFNAAATRAQVASTQLDSDDPETAVAAAQIVHEFHKKVAQSEIAQNWADKVIGGYESRAMLSGATTISKNLVGNEIELAVVTGAMYSKYGKNDVDANAMKAETDRLTKIYESSLLSIPQMENLTDQSLVHGEAYGIGDNSVTVAGVQVRTIGNTKIPDPLAILGRSDFYFRRNVYLKSLAYQASAYARKHNLNATDVFNQWKKLSNNTPDGIKARKEAVLTAHSAVFTQNGALAEALNRVRNVLNRAIPLGTKYGLGNMIAPFVKTPANIVELGARALVSPFSSTWQYMKTGELDVAHRVDLGNLGVALLFLAATVLANGDYEPPYQQGLRYDPKRPYDSIRIAGVWIKLDTLGPLATPLRLMLSASGVSKQKNAWKRGVEGTFGDIPFDLDRVKYAITNPTKGGINWVEGELDKAIPAVVSDFAKIGGHMSGITVESPFESFGNKTIRKIGMDGQNPSVNDWIRAVGLGIIRIDENN